MVSHSYSQKRHFCFVFVVFLFVFFLGGGVFVFFFVCFFCCCFLMKREKCIVNNVEWKIPKGQSFGGNGIHR